MSIWRPLSVLPLLFISAIAQFSFEFSGHHDVKPKVSLSADIHDLPNVLDFFPEHREDILGDEAAATKGGRKRDSSSVKTDYLGKWELFSRNSGVSAMHAILLPVINKVLMYDATIWRISQIKLPPGKRCHIVKQATGKKDCWAHAVLLDINTAALKPLMLDTDTWCSSGGLSVNGTLVGTGGFQGGANTVRYLGICDNCDWVEYPNALAAPRWYSTQATLGDGSFIVVGGRAAMSYEFIPAEGTKNTKIFQSKLLQETTDKSENNLYPFVYLSTDGNVFIFANDRSILLNPRTNQVIKQYPVLPGGARNYPGSGMSALLPIRLFQQNPAVINAEVLVCGGAPHNAYELAGHKVFGPALRDCGRISITHQNPRWKIEMMPTPRVMGDAMILPNGDVLLLNGAKQGSAGWHYAKEPNLNPVLYMTHAKRGYRFRELAASNIPRMYHSSSVLLPDGQVLIAGSNTNDGYVYNTEYPTEMRVEKFSPPYLDPKLRKLRPDIIKFSMPKRISYGNRFHLQIRSRESDVSKDNIMITMYSPAFTTHGISMNQRLLILGLSDVLPNIVPRVHGITAVAPPSGNIAPPGYYILFVVYRGVPSVGEWVQIL
ncbi:aldehyde oxidase GLOX1 [Carica papaya]|uniref:aldehyde oxidase GLOX1 n=1 Tax=Carica papaya TaxID=3649 RepID=UPI000B8D1995|nr:aldehyde oxidase GLOX1 [Carica papaya]